MMNCYIDQDGYLMSLTPVQGGTLVEAPDLKFPTSQHRLVNGAWELSDVTPERVITEAEAERSRLADEAARKSRQQLLADSDWTDTASAPARLGDALYAQWQAYRQALRDITAQPGYPNQIEWPTEPT